MGRSTLENRRYHEGELAIALSANNRHRVMPRVPESARRILDVGCGAGQTAIGLALGPNVLAVGIDPDAEALSLAQEWTAPIELVRGSGESLPFRDDSFDFVISRVAMPYMHIPAAIGDIARVLASGGHLWVTLQPLRITLDHLRQSLQSGHPKAALFQVYSLFNGLLFHLVGRMVRWPLSGGRYESFQTAQRISRSLRSAGFVDIVVASGEHFVVTARKS